MADQHFELFVKQERESEVTAREIVEDPERQDEPVELNLDTIFAVLRRVYPTRPHVDRSEPAMSEFVEELHAAGMDDVRDVERALRRAERVFEPYEQDVVSRPHVTFEQYADVGAARVSLAMTDERFQKVVQEKPGFDLPPARYWKLIEDEP